MSRRQTLIYLLCSSLLGYAEPAAAAITVQQEECPELDVVELQRLLMIELQALQQQPAGLHSKVAVKCQQGAFEITVQVSPEEAPVTRHVYRDPSAGAARERELALLISQQFFPSWAVQPPSETAPAQPKPEPKSQAKSASEAKQKPPEPRPPPAAATPVEDKAPRTRSSVGRTLWELDVHLRGGVRDLQRPFFSWAPEARLSATYAGWRLLLAASFEQGTAARQLGEVSARAAAAGLGIGRRFALSSNVDFDLDLQGEYVFASFEPRAQQDGVTVTSLSGSAAQLQVLGGPRLELGSLDLGLALRVGYTIPRVLGHVSQEASVHLDGLWFAGGLFIGVPLGGS